VPALPAVVRGPAFSGDINAFGCFFPRLLVFLPRKNEDGFNFFLWVHLWVYSCQHGEAFRFLVLAGARLAILRVVTGWC